MRLFVQVLTFTLASATLLSSTPASAVALSEIREANCKNASGFFHINRMTNEVAVQFVGQPLYLNKDGSVKNPINPVRRGTTSNLGSEVVSTGKEKQKGVAFMSSGLYQDIGVEGEFPVSFVNHQGAIRIQTMRCVFVR